MKLSDLLALTLKNNKVHHVFGLQGGAVVHIFDSLERAGVGVTYTHHEESASLAAVAHSKVMGNLGCVVVTSGPGATNAITGCLAAWQDSIPVIFISGQVRAKHTSYGRKVRQVGTQEVNICDIVRPITKYCKFIESKNDFDVEIRKAIGIAKYGRPGPVWLDIPVDLQWMDIESFDDSEVKKQKFELKASENIPSLKSSFDILSKAEKPLLVLGYGVRLSGAYEQIKKLINNYLIPFVTTWTAADLFPTSHSLNMGIIGMSGQRGANQIMHDADVIVCLGTHLSIPHTTTLFDDYAPQSQKIIVNIDQDQLDNLNVNFDVKIHSDLHVYLEWLLSQGLKKYHWPHLNLYKERNWYVPTQRKHPNSNIYIHRLTEVQKEPACIVVDGGGTALYAGFQSSVFKEGDRVICSSAISAMGTGLAEVIGVSAANMFPKIFCIIGDGSFLMNVQDLQTISQNKMNVVISVINNNGYAAIRHTQKDFLEGRYYGTHPMWSLQMPSIEKIAEAFEIAYKKLDHPENMEAFINSLNELNGPVICEIVVDEDQAVLFKQGYKANQNGTFTPQPLSDMTLDLL